MIERSLEEHLKECEIDNYTRIKLMSKEEMNRFLFRFVINEFCKFMTDGSAMNALDQRVWLSSTDHSLIDQLLDEHWGE